MDWKHGIREQAVFKVDYDTHRHNPIQRFNFRLKYMLKYMYWITDAKVLVFKTKKGFHFYIYPKFASAVKKEFSTDPEFVVMSQLILGSDWLRELRNLNRAVIYHDDNWNLLFSDKSKSGREQHERFYCAYVIKR